MSNLPTAHEVEAAYGASSAFLSDCLKVRQSFRAQLKDEAWFTPQWRSPMLRGDHCQAAKQTLEKLGPIFRRQQVRYLSIRKRLRPSMLRAARLVHVTGDVTFHGLARGSYLDIVAALAKHEDDSMPIDHEDDPEEACLALMRHPYEELGLELISPLRLHTELRAKLKAEKQGLLKLIRGPKRPRRSRRRDGDLGSGPGRRKTPARVPQLHTQKYRPPRVAKVSSGLVLGFDGEKWYKFIRGRGRLLPSLLDPQPTHQNARTLTAFVGNEFVSTNDLLKALYLDPVSRTKNGKPRTTKFAIHRTSEYLLQALGLGTNVKLFDYMRGKTPVFRPLIPILCVTRDEDGNLTICHPDAS